MPRLLRRVTLSAAASILAGWTLLPGVSGGQTAPKPDHFECYNAQETQPGNGVVRLQDQFDAQPVATQVGPAVAFCNPVQKRFNGVTTPITNREGHAKVYLIRGDQTTVRRFVVVNNQFGQAQKLVTRAPVALVVPAQKLPLPAPQGLDHYKCYEAKGNSVNAVVGLVDQFHRGRARVLEPVAFCNPTVKVHNDVTYPITNPDAHYTCYFMRTGQFSTSVDVVDQFGPEHLRLSDPNVLCVPSEKVRFKPPTAAG